MKTSFRRALTLFLTGLLSASLGWWLRGSHESETPAGQAPAREPVQASGQQVTPDVPARAGDRQGTTGTVAGVRSGTHPGLERMLSTDPADMLGMMEAIGS